MKSLTQRGKTQTTKFSNAKNKIMITPDNKDRNYLRTLKTLLNK